LDERLRPLAIRVIRYFEERGGLDPMALDSREDPVEDLIERLENHLRDPRYAEWRAQLDGEARGDKPPGLWGLALAEGWAIYRERMAKDGRPEGATDGEPSPFLADWVRSSRVRPSPTARTHGPLTLALFLVPDAARFAYLHFWVHRRSPRILVDLLAPPLRGSLNAVAGLIARLILAIDRDPPLDALEGEERRLLRRFLAGERLSDGEWRLMRTTVREKLRARYSDIIERLERLERLERVERLERRAAERTESTTP